MNQLVPVNIDREVLAEFIEGIEQVHQNIERISITLENSPDDLQSLGRLRNLFQDLFFSSSKLDIIPISESLEETIKSLNLLLKFNCYPVIMSEFILLLMDRILMLSRDVEKNLVINIRKTQHLLVALQHILMVDKVENIEHGIEKAIVAITRDIYDNLDDMNNDDADVVLFDDGVDLFQETPQEPYPQNPLSIDIAVSEDSKNPILEAREYIKQNLDGKPIMLLAKISDLATDHGESHTSFLLELSLAINILSGESIDMMGLSYGVCAHDIALSAITNIINKKEKLSQEEVNEIRKHPYKGAELIKEFNCPVTAVEVVLEHHERMDGSGYPFGLKGADISDAGKLVAIVDSFHGMTHHRPHKKYTKNILRAVAEINACVDTQYDRHWVKQFNNCIRKYWLPLQHKNH